MLPRSEQNDNSTDSVVDEAEPLNYLVEILNSIQPTGTSPHCRRLKEGAPRLCNRTQTRLGNDTKLVVKKSKSNVKEATIFSERGNSEDVFTP